MLVGDPAQLPELGAGGLFAGLLRRLDPIMLAAHRRQRHDWDRRVLAHLRAGDPAPLVAAYRQHERLTVAGTDALARDRMAADWASWARDPADGQLGEGIMLAGCRGDVDALNRAARELLRAADRLGPDALHAAGRAYAVGDRIVCLRKRPAAGGHQRHPRPGDHRRRPNRALTVQVDGAAAREVSLPGRYVRSGHVAHGYAVTVHKAQGATVDRAWVYADTKSVYAQWLYTALSRHRDAARLYTSIHHPGAACRRPRGAHPATPLSNPTEPTRSPRLRRAARAAARRPLPAITPRPASLNPIPQPRLAGRVPWRRSRRGRSGLRRSGCRCDPTPASTGGPSMDADDRVYEFLLSDHPAAKAERLARRADHLARRAAVAAWRDRIVTFGGGVPANLQNLAETMGRIDERATLRDAAEQAEPDEVWVARARQRFTATARTWGDDPDYRYPDRYLGPAAARQPNLLAATPPTQRPPGPGLAL